MPAYNEALYVATAVDSILAQTHRELELIIVDDGSTDRTPEILERYRRREGRVRIHRQANTGIVGALNAGIRRVSADWIARMDANDVSSPDRLERQLQFLTRHPDVGAVGTWMATITASGSLTAAIWRTPVSPGEVAWMLHFGSALVHPSVVFRREALLAVSDAQGPYRGAEVQHCEDYDLWSRLLPVVRLANVPRVLHLRRALPGSISVRHHAAQDSAGQRIMARTVSSLLGRTVCDQEIGLLVRAHRRASMDVEAALRVASLLAEMHERFGLRYSPNRRERALIAHDLARKLFYLGAARRGSSGAAGLFDGLGYLWSRLPPEARRRLPAAGLAWLVSRVRRAGGS